MSTRRILVLAALVLAVVAAPASARAEAPSADAVYCYYAGAVYVSGQTVYPGGKYCVPAP